MSTASEEIREFVGTARAYTCEGGGETIQPNVHDKVYVSRDGTKRWCAQHPPGRPTPAPSVPAVRTPTGLRPIDQIPDGLLLARYNVTREEIDAIKSRLGTDANDYDLLLFLGTCHRYALDPFTNQVHLVKFRNRGDGHERYIPVIGLDGYRAIAEMTREYDGADEPEFKYGSNGALEACTVRVYRKGMSHPISSTIFLDEAKPKNRGPDDNWNTRPKQMLAAAAERHALRRAFPRTLSGAPSEDSEEPEVLSPEQMTRRRAQGLPPVEVEVPAAGEAANVPSVPHPTEVPAGHPAPEPVGDDEDPALPELRSKIEALCHTTDGPLNLRRLDLVESRLKAMRLTTLVDARNVDVPALEALECDLRQCGKVRET
jgi:phage recombination protein Bet